MNQVEDVLFNVGLNLDVVNTAFGVLIETIDSCNVSMNRDIKQIDAAARVVLYTFQQAQQEIKKLEV